MYTKRELIGKLKEQLAVEYNCKPQDFSRIDNLITIAENEPGRRQYIQGKFFMQMVTLGQNAVITANAHIHPWLGEFTSDKTGHQLFEHHNLCEIDNMLKQHGKQLWQTHHMYLPETGITTVSELAPTRWFEQEEIQQFYGQQLYPNALCSRFLPNRPDILAVAAYEGDEIIGMACCSADTPEMWQVGIDVNRNYRGRGLGTYLVTMLKNEILRRGKIPFYGTSLSNLHSQNIALNSGFFPAWIEVETMEDM